MNLMELLTQEICMVNIAIIARYIFLNGLNFLIFLIYILDI
jgi:hypothetical protein